MFSQPVVVRSPDRANSTAESGRPPLSCARLPAAHSCSCSKPSRLSTARRMTANLLSREEEKSIIHVLIFNPNWITPVYAIKIQSGFDPRPKVGLLQIRALYGMPYVPKVLGLLYISQDKLISYPNEKH